jgi:hypothetical protein
MDERKVIVAARRGDARPSIPNAIDRLSRAACLFYPYSVKSSTASRKKPLLSAIVCALANADCRLRQAERLDGVALPRGDRSTNPFRLIERDGCAYPAQIWSISPGKICPAVGESCSAFGGIAKRV